MSEKVNKVERQIMIDWKNLEWLQTEETKDISDVNMEKLKESLRANGFIQPFNVWEDKERGKLFILDGHHRRKAMLELEDEGFTEFNCKLPANVINCKDRKEAIKYLLLYSSNYAIINKEGLSSFLTLENIDISELMSDVSIQNVDLEELIFDEESFSGKNKEVDVDEFEEEMTLSFKFKERIYNLVKERLAEIDSIKEDALVSVLGIEDIDV